MTIVVSLPYTANSLMAKALETSVEGLNRLAQSLYEEDLKISPTDTEDYINSWKVIPAEKQGDNMVAYVENDSQHASIVETGILGLPFQYHRGPRSDPNREVIYQGLSGEDAGARVAQRAIDNLFNL